MGVDFAFTLPKYCEYVTEGCDQELPDPRTAGPFFLYPSNPTAVAATIEEGVRVLRAQLGMDDTRSWRSLPIAGQMIFCEICKAMRSASTIVADVTTLNFNLLFEIGFAIGLGVPIVPIRDTTYSRDHRDFEELGVLDTLGYIDFTNSSQLASKLRAKLPGVPLPPVPEKLFRDQPLYVLKGKIETEGAVRLMSTLKKSALFFRTYDPIETPRLSLTEARRQVAGSFGVVAHLLSPHRKGATTHNGLCALLCGIAMAQQKVVAMVQEEQVIQPIDYRDVVQWYSDPNQISQLLERFVRAVVTAMQSAAPVSVVVPRRLLEKLDLGDTAAENEIRGLRSYFVRTGQFTQARQGHARLVVGRKGTGKTAMFYAIRDSIPRGPLRLILDMKPEGHQFTRLREMVLSRLSPGVQEHTMTAFWNYILLTEIARKIVLTESHYAHSDSTQLGLFNQVKAFYEQYGGGRDDDFSQRLLQHVEQVCVDLQQLPEKDVPGQITQRFYSRDVHDLTAALSEYLKEKEAVWLLFDNIDKGWPTRGATESDIVIVRALLEATRKLQRQMQNQEVELNCLVFLRTDIYERLVEETADKGKETAINLDADDSQVFEDIIKRRVQESVDIAGGFREIWPRMFESHIGVEDSFGYIVRRTLMRPRDLLLFLHRAVEVALNRGHQIVEADDVLQAEKGVSEDLLLMTEYEIADTHFGYRDLLYLFEGSGSIVSRSDIARILELGKVALGEIETVIDVLLWFGFLGVISNTSEERYSYQVRYNVNRLKVAVQKGEGRYVVHPGYRAALSIGR